MAISGIYIIYRPAAPERIYVGQSVNLARRKSEHFNGRKSNRPLARAMAKYGRDAFVFQVVHEAPRERLSECERAMAMYYIASGYALFNLDEPGHGGRQMSDEARRRLSDVFCGQKRPQCGAKNIGRKWTHEQREKIMAWQRTKGPCSESHKENIRAAKIGSHPRPKSRESIERGAAKIRGVPKSAAARERYRAVNQARVGIRIVATLPDGQTRQFASLHDAAADLGISRPGIRYALAHSGIVSGVRVERLL